MAVLPRSQVRAQPNLDCIQNDAIVIAKSDKEEYICIASTKIVLFNESPISSVPLREKKPQNDYAERSGTKCPCLHPHKSPLPHPRPPPTRLPSLPPYPTLRTVTTAAGGGTGSRKRDRKPEGGAGPPPAHALVAGSSVQRSKRQPRPGRKRPTASGE